MGLSPLVGTAKTAAPNKVTTAVTASKTFLRFTAGLLRTAADDTSGW